MAMSEFQRGFFIGLGVGAALLVIGFAGRLFG